MHYRVRYSLDFDPKIRSGQVCIMKELWDVAHEKLTFKKGRHGVLDMLMDVGHILEMAIYVVNQLKNDSYC